MKIDGGKILTGLLALILATLGVWLVTTVADLEDDQRATLTAVKLFHGQAEPADILPAVMPAFNATTGWEGVGVGGPDCCFSADLYERAARRAVALLDDEKPGQAREVLVDALRAGGK